MVATLTLISSQPNELRYLFAYDGSGSLVATKTKAELITDALTCATGVSQLAALLNSVGGGSDWTALFATGKIDLFLTPQIQSVGASSMAAKFNGISTTLDVTGVALANGDEGVVILRMNPTPMR